jgi:hypothetical protein
MDRDSAVNKFYRDGDIGNLIAKSKKFSEFKDCFYKALEINDKSAQEKSLTEMLKISEV